ncbi:MAG TPA: glycosyl hydrolase, partial [Phnomibacter sp.]|nr:glycosyl hydrolase [Phnomibacter sp.]
MNKTFSRMSAALLLLGVIASLFYFITMAGKKESGPLEDMLGVIGSKVASWEKNVVRDNEGSRSASLQWFHVIRNSTIRLNHLDTILTGAYDDNTAESYESIVSLEDSLQFNLPVVSIYTAWGSKKIQVFPLLRAQAIYDLGSIPLITWEPWLNDFDEESYPFLKGVVNKNLNGMNAIAAGKYDGYIDKWAADAKKFGVPFFLRFGHEMNDPYRYPWGVQNNTPWEFIAAWRHIHERFKLAGATNVLWLWSPHPAYQPYADFYPGHEYV